MRPLGLRVAARRRGLTLLEMAIAVSIFTTLGLSLFTVVDTARRSQEAVSAGIANNEELRKAFSSIAEELQCTRESLVEVVVLADRNHQVTFQMPIELGGVMGWGVDERSLGTTEAEQVRPGWYLRYTVVQEVDPTGYVNHVLRRQVLDDAFAVQLEETIAEGLNEGDDDDPGFTVARAGEMWEVSFSTDGHGTGTNGRKAVFHVATRN